MGRKKTISSEKLIEMFNEYRIENHGRKCTIPQFGLYLRNKGVSINDYTIRRDLEFRKYLDNVNKSSEIEIYNNLVCYKSLDVDAFIDLNNTRSKLKEAISSLDKYYSCVAANGAEALRLKKESQEYIQKLENRISDLENELINVQAKVDNKEIKIKNDIIRKLRIYINSYIYPDAANAILAKDGILDVINSLIPDELMEKNIIHADSEIKESKYNAINKIIGDFNE